VDFGFINPAAAAHLRTVPLQNDEMLVVLPRDHPLEALEEIPLDALAGEPYILLDEGQLSEPLEHFRQRDLYPNVQFQVVDDYTILSMVEQGLGITILPQLVLGKTNHRIVTRPISPSAERTWA
jgi:DNA-binding transcriptional LysR family regulator